MVNEKIFHPGSIVVVGGSENVSKPGGKIIRNLLDSGYKGQLYVVNPTHQKVQGIPALADVHELPGEIDLAILAVHPDACLKSAEILAFQKNVRAFIVISAGFSEEGPEGAQIENRLTELINQIGGCLIGPNCSGVMTPFHKSVFSEPLPELSHKGADFISASGAMAVFILESGMKKGVRFNNVIMVGNSAQTTAEDLLEYLDHSFDPALSSKVKLLYIESIRNPQKLLTHAASLVAKGCLLAAVKAGASEAGSRAASSHTGALANDDVAVDALFRKAGIIRCYSREELVNVSGVLMCRPFTGKKIAIITHAGGPAVLLTDCLTRGGIEVPHLDNKALGDLQMQLLPGSCIHNPIDFLATGTALHLKRIIEVCDSEVEEVDGMVVIFGSPGLSEVDSAYMIIHQAIRDCHKPVYPVLPSTLNAAAEVQRFIDRDNVCFSDEVLFGQAFIKVYQQDKRSDYENGELEPAQMDLLTRIIESGGSGFQNPDVTGLIFNAIGFPVVSQHMVTSFDDLVLVEDILSFPVVAKVVGPIHKTEVNGIALFIHDFEKLIVQYHRLMSIDGAVGVLIQRQLTGPEFFIGVKQVPSFGHVLLFGTGGINLEVYKDFTEVLLPVSQEEALCAIRRIKGYALIKGYRGQRGWDELTLAKQIVSISQMISAFPQIAELDVNPIMADENRIFAVDIRMRLI